MGIVAPFRGKGGGRRLMSAALAWARAQPQIAWVDLGVFSANHRARALYDKFDFVEIGVRRDAFRVDGDVVDDIEMTLSVSASTSGSPASTT